ncbi:MAG: LysM peptidoglycan-binding domain-containing protein [Candidatus Rokubacteria bacterium]|nr:LysM peptidoglycan-binding domain-containing protein [Candidatus Rokubacteria bacterium]
MRARRRRLAGSLVLLALGVSACATVDPSREPAPGSPRTRTAPPPAAPTPGPAALSAREILAAAHHRQAESLEQQGFLRRAREEWQIALTVNPKDTVAQQGLKAIEARIEQLVAERIRDGRGALARGSRSEARRLLLSALALDPSNRAAFEILQNEVREVEFVTHRVGPGDSLVSLAQRYYGDRSRAEVIAETNQLALNARLAPGTAVKIPEIPGVPFIHPEARVVSLPRESAVATAPPSAAPGGARPEVLRPGAPPPEPAPARPEAPEVNPLLLDAREAMDKGDYALALADVDRLLAGSPGNREGLDLKKALLYRQAKGQLDQKKLDQGYKTLTQLARVDPNYEDASALLKQTRVRLVESHYSEGLRLYREEKLTQAIGEWRVVLEIDPQHANARRSIEQAERLLRGLEERRKK